MRIDFYFLNSTGFIYGLHSLCINYNENLWEKLNDKVNISGSHNISEYG